MVAVIEVLLHCLVDIFLYLSFISSIADSNVINAVIHRALMVVSWN